MGNGKSRVIAANYSSVSFTNEGDLNCNKGRARKRADDDEFNSKLVELCCKKNSKISENNKNKDLDCVMRKIQEPQTRLPRSKSCECKYTLEPLTASQQLEEVEAVLKERAKAGEMSTKRQRRSEKKAVTCCECAREIRRMEKRNGLQAVLEPEKKNCQCCMCKGQMGKLSEAQAIADAIQEYCRRERQRALEIIRKERNGEKAHKCCMCNTKIDEESNYSDDEIEIDLDIEPFLDTCCCTQFKEYPKRAQKCCKCAIAAPMGEIKQEEESEDEKSDEENNDGPVEDEYIHTPESTDHDEELNEAGDEFDEDAAIKPSVPQKHARDCRCCDCNKQQHNPTRVPDNITDISVGDIEVEIQAEEVKIMPEKQARNETRSQPRNQKQSNHKQAPQNVIERKESEREAMWEVFMKKSNLAPELEDADSAYAPAVKQRRERPTESDKSDDDRTHVQSCRCCDCKKTAEPMNIGSIEYKVEEQSPKQQLNFSKNSEDRPGTPRSSLAINHNRLNNSYIREESITSEQEYQTKEQRKKISVRSEDYTLTRDRAADKSKNLQQSRRFSKDTEKSAYTEAHSREQRKKTSDRSDGYTLTRDRATDTSKNLQQSRRFSKDTEKSAYTEAHSREQRKKTSDRSDDYTLTRDRATDKSKNLQKSRRFSKDTEAHSRGCMCCECKNQEEKTESDYTAVIEENETVADLEIEVEPERGNEKETCCCFTRKRTNKETPQNYEAAMIKRNEKQTKTIGCCSCRKSKDSTPSKSPEKDNKQTKTNGCCSCRKTSDKDNKRSTDRSRSHSRSQSRSEQHCQRIGKQFQTECSCNKRKGVPLTKCCACTQGTEHQLSSSLSAAAAKERKRESEEEKERKKLAEELAKRLQRRAALQVELQKRLQDQRKTKQKSCCCYCCCEPSAPSQPSCCYTPIPCCAPNYCVPPPQPCSFQPNPCCYLPSQPAPAQPMYGEQPPTCCYEPPSSYGQECPCCCQPIPFCYTASCSYGKTGAMPPGMNPG
ncbi:caldesmon-like [Eurosta solidaginis]|uniref:caldesmon-like n=1 Tax=Eurosta solidaginis TaxID=178769 RepID=UPI00353131DA